MVAELDSITDPAERTRFAIGAMAAILRLSLSGGLRGGTIPDSGGPVMAVLTAGQLLARHALPFCVSFGALTALLLANQAVRLIPSLTAAGVPAGGIVEVMLLAVPHTVALTIPMAVFLAATWVFTRLGTGDARDRRMVAPVLGAATVVALLTFVSNAQVVPRTNARLAEALSVTPAQLSDRTMTLGELREAARDARTGAGPEATLRAATYEVEIQKKMALAAASMVLALAGAAIGLRFPGRGTGLVLGAGVVVFGGYYASMIAGESLADRLMVSPFVAMWMANVVLLALVLVLLRRRGGPGTGPRTKPLALDV